MGYCLKVEPWGLLYLGHSASHLDVPRGLDDVLNDAGHLEGGYVSHVVFALFFIVRRVVVVFTLAVVVDPVVPAH